MESLKTYLRRLSRGFSCGGTRVRSNHLTKWAGRAWHARATLKTQYRKGVGAIDALAKRGCAIPWRRPSWVRIPPPAPTYHTVMDTSSVSSQNIGGRARFDFSPGEDHYGNYYAYHERQNYQISKIQGNDVLYASSEEYPRNDEYYA